MLFCSWVYMSGAAGREQGREGVWRGVGPRAGLFPLLRVSLTAPGTVGSPWPTLLVYILRGKCLPTEKLKGHARQYHQIQRFHCVHFVAKWQTLFGALVAVKKKKIDKRVPLNDERTWPAQCESEFIFRKMGTLKDTMSAIVFFFEAGGSAVSGRRGVAVGCGL